MVQYQSSEFVCLRFLYHCTEVSYSMKGEKFLDQLSDYQILKKDYDS
jgi:hypothetical protein